MLQVSRNNNLKIPKQLEDCNECINSNEDKVAVKQALATAQDKKFNKKQEKIRKKEKNIRKMQLLN